MPELEEDQEVLAIHPGVVFETSEGPRRVGRKYAERFGLTGREVWYIEYADGTFSGNYATEADAYEDEAYCLWTIKQRGKR